jgi:hypothetical protein
MGIINNGIEVGNLIFNVPLDAQIHYIMYVSIIV